MKLTTSALALFVLTCHSIGSAQAVQKKSLTLDGAKRVIAKSLQSGKGIKSVAVFNTPVGANAPGPIAPGAAYEVTISAVTGDRLS